MIALEGDHSDFDFWSFIDRENELDGVGGGNLFICRLHHGELVAVLGFEILNGDFGLLDFRGVKLAFDREADLAILESIENV